jgi:hypothetical protein
MGTNDKDKELREKAEREAAKRRANVSKLKDVISDLPAYADAVGTSDQMILIGRALDVYGFIMTGLDIAATVKDAMNVARVIHLLHDSELGAMSLQQSGRLAQLATSGSTSVMAASRYLFAANVLGVLATYVGVWISLGSGYAQAKVEIFTEQAMSGVSQGVMLGANNALAPYVGQNFQMTVKPMYPMYREIEGAAMNMHNIALLAGYAHGRSLSQNQKLNLGRYIHGRMTEGQRNYFAGGWSTYGPRTKKDYYIDTGAIFRRELLRAS